MTSSGPSTSTKTDQRDVAEPVVEGKRIRRRSTALRQFEISWRHVNPAEDLRAVLDPLGVEKDSEDEHAAKQQLAHRSWHGEPEQAVGEDQDQNGADDRIADQPAKPPPSDTPPRTTAVTTEISSPIPVSAPVLPRRAENRKAATAVRIPEET